MCCLNLVGLLLKNFDFLKRFLNLALVTGEHNVLPIEEHSCAKDSLWVEQMQFYYKIWFGSLGQINTAYYSMAGWQRKIFVWNESCGISWGKISCYGKLAFRKEYSKDFAFDLFHPWEIFQNISNNKHNFCNIFWSFS